MSANESLLQFPCDFPIKAMGRNAEKFDLLIIELVRKHAPDFPETAVSSKLSKGEKYLSVTITILAQSQQQLDAIYQDLTDCESVLIAL